MWKCEIFSVVPEGIIMTSGEKTSGYRVYYNKGHFNNWELHNEMDCPVKIRK